MTVEVRDLGVREYTEVLAEMRAYTERRVEGRGDAIWLVEHPPVFTLGKAGSQAHVLAPGGIPVVRTDRGCQVTYDGPGQVVLYAMCELRRHRLNVRRLVCGLEESVIRYLCEHGVRGERRAGAPGVYVGGRKIAALGLRIRKGCSYHGLALNVAMDLEPFRRIDPCGYPGLEVTQLRDFGVDDSVAQCGRRVAALCIECLT